MNKDEIWSKINYYQGLMTYYNGLALDAEKKRMEYEKYEKDSNLYIKKIEAVITALHHVNTRCGLASNYYVEGCQLDDQPICVDMLGSVRSAGNTEITNLESLEEQVNSDIKKFRTQITKYQEEYNKNIELFNGAYDNYKYYRDLV